MYNTLSQIIANESKIKTTENGAIAYKSLDNPVLTLFAQAGALRPRDEQEIREMFRQAYAYDSDLAIKMVFYIGDIRGGLGERRTFRICLNELAKLNPHVVAANLLNIAYYNRWDSLYDLIGTGCENDMWDFMRSQFVLDCVAHEKKEPCSLLAKWMKSVNASSEETKRLGRMTMKALGFASEKHYRKALAQMRKYLDVVETKMSANDWENIKYAQVPSYAMKNYRNAFTKHDAVGFGKYMAEVQAGQSEIKASTLFPYDLAKVYTDAFDWRNHCSIPEDSVIEAQWKALPNYLKDDNTNVICMVDVSGSMYGRPIASSIGLGIYFAQHNHGAFHNQFMTFTTNPHFITIEEGASLRSIVEDVYSKEVGYSTNLEAAFRALLRVAIAHDVSQEDMPKALIILSDNEIDKYKNQRSVDFMTSMRQQYEARGYHLPKLIFFQVEARQSTFLTLSNDALFISGQSAAAFKQVVDNIEGTSWDLVLNTLNSERYAQVITRSNRE